MFVKLTSMYDDVPEPIYIVIDYITHIKVGGVDSKGSIVFTNCGSDNDVVETPEKILQLINQAKFSDLLDKEIATPTNIIKRSNKVKKGA